MQGKPTMCVTCVWVIAIVKEIAVVKYLHKFPKEKTRNSIVYIFFGTEISNLPVWVSPRIYSKYVFL